MYLESARLSKPLLINVLLSVMFSDSCIQIAGNTDVVFLLSEQEMKRITVDSVELHVRIESEGSGLYTIQTPGVKVRMNK